jgi:hypothetical protein
MIEAGAAILAFERSSGAHRLLCVFNLGHDTRSWRPSEPERWRIIERSDERIEKWTLPRLSGLIAERIDRA